MLLELGGEADALAAQLEEYSLTDGVLSLWVQHVEERERELTARENTIKARERNLGLREATVDASTRATLMEMLAKREASLETRERVVVETEQQLGAERESSIKLKTALDGREKELAARIAGFGRFVFDFERLEERERCLAKTSPITLETALVREDREKRLENKRGPEEDLRRGAPSSRDGAPAIICDGASRMICPPTRRYEDMVREDSGLASASSENRAGVLSAGSALSGALVGGAIVVDTTQAELEVVTASRRGAREPASGRGVGGGGGQENLRRGAREASSRDDDGAPAMICDGASRTTTQAELANRPRDGESEEVGGADGSRDEDSSSPSQEPLRSLAGRRRLISFASTGQVDEEVSRASGHQQDLRKRSRTM